MKENQPHDEVHCLKCDNVWTEHVFLSVCPYCGNDDTQQTVYLQPQED